MKYIWKKKNHKKNSCQSEQKEFSINNIRGQAKIITRS